MVSTRGVKLKFSEGERILCYEPDPTKAKVLYDSRVLQIFPAKETKGKKQIEYLIHFQGWNASWDRRVPEDFVLKCTEESRELQRNLAERSQFKLSIKSNRVLSGPGLPGKEKKRKRHLSETVRDTIEEEKRKNEETDMPYETETAEDSSSVSSEVISPEMNLFSESDTNMSEEIFLRFFPLNIPEALKLIVERDYHQINDKNKLLCLPSERPILFILEDYVRYFAARFATRKRDKQKSEFKEKDKMFLTLDLCKEVIDSIRISFDYYLHTILLYKKEKQQASNLKKVAVQHLSQQSVRHTKLSTSLASNGSKDKKNKVDRKEDLPRRYLRSKGLPVDEPLPELKESKSVGLQPESGRSTPTTITSGGSTSGLYSLADDDIAGYTRHLRGLSHMSQNWTLLPDAYRLPGTPVLIYGATHLLRLIVKLPEILSEMNITSERKGIVQRHVELILEYLNSHSKELFSETNYISGTEI